MIREEAEKILDLLETKNDLTKEDIVQGYQISLGLGRHLKALEYQEKYCDLTYSPEENRSRLLRIVRETGASSQSIDIAQKALEYVKDGKESLKYHLLCNIAWLQKDFALDASIKKLSELGDKHTRYKIAKAIFFYDHRKALEIIGKLPEKYKLAFHVYMHTYHFSEDGSIEEVEELLGKLEERADLNDQTYGDMLLEIAFAIVQFHPLKAYSILEKLHGNYGEGLTLEVEVVKAIAPINLDKAIEHIGKIEIDSFKVEAIIHLIEVYHDTDSLMTIFDSLESLIGESVDCYMVLYQLKKKISIPFEILYDVASKLQPEELFFDQEVLETYYFRCGDKLI